MILSDAWKLAEKCQAALVEFCDKCEIVGSIRRARPQVNDIDLVCLPKLGRGPALRDRVKERTTVVQEGPHTLIVRLRNGVQLDIWFASHPESDLLTQTPGNWGSVLLCRTGSREHNIYLADRAQNMGLQWHTTRGIFREETCLASETEEEIFKSLELPWLAPAFREK